MTLTFKLIALIASIGLGTILESPIDIDLHGQVGKPVVKWSIYRRLSGPGTLEDVTRSSDAIVRVHVLTTTVVKDPIVTNGPFPELRTIQNAKVLEVLRASRATTVGEVITIVRKGGEYDDVDRRLVGENEGDPPLASNGEYLLWLSWDSPSAAFVTTHGLNSVFQILDGRLKQLGEAPLATKLNSWTVPQIKMAIEKIR